jgi:hypothetical protein
MLVLVKEIERPDRLESEVTLLYHCVIPGGRLLLLGAARR